MIVSIDATGGMAVYKCAAGCRDNSPRPGSSVPLRSPARVVAVRAPHFPVEIVQCLI